VSHAATLCELDAQPQTFAEMKRFALVSSLALIVLLASSTSAMAKGSKLRVEDNAEYGKILVNG
jgi:hypothetical protein